MAWQDPPSCGPWFPAVIRNGGTDSLAFLFCTSRAFNAAIPTLRAAMAAADTTVIVPALVQP